MRQFGLLISFVLFIFLGCDQLKNADKQEDKTIVVDPVAVSLNLTGVSSLVNNESCDAMTLTSLNANGQATPVTTDTTIALSEQVADSSLAITFYADAGCANVLLDNNFTLTAGASTQKVYFVVSDLVISTIPFGQRSIVASSAALSSATYSFTVTPNPAATFTLFNISPSHNPFLKDTCYETYLNVMTADNRETVLNPSENETLTFATTPVGGAVIYLDSSCTTNAGTVVLPAGTTWLGPFYFKISAAGGDNNVQFTFTSQGGVSGTATLPVNP